MTAPAVPPLKTLDIPQHAENADAVLVNLLKPDKEFTTSVDATLGLCSGFLRCLPEGYRRVIATTYLTFLRSCEELYNDSHSNAIKLAFEAFEKANKEMLDPVEFTKQWNFRKLQLEETLLEDELSPGDGPISWKALDLKVKEHEFTKDRWLILLINRSPQSAEQKKEEVEKILGAAQIDDCDLIELYVSKENFAKNCTTILGQFVHNAMFHLAARCHAIMEIGKKSRNRYGDLTSTEKMLLLLHYYVRSYSSLMELRTDHIDVLTNTLNDTRGESKPYSTTFRFPTEAYTHFQKASPRINAAIDGSPRQNVLKLTAAQVDGFFKQLHKTYKNLKRFTSMIEVHTSTNFSASERELASQHCPTLAGSISRISLEDVEKPDPVEAPPSPNALKRLTNIDTIIKLSTNHQAFEKMVDLFKRVDFYYQKNHQHHFLSNFY